MWADDQVWHLKVLFFKNEIVTDKKQKNIKNRVNPTTGSITKSGFVKKTFEKWIKKI